jgi:hypothetical protein
MRLGLHVGPVESHLQDSSHVGHRRGRMIVEIDELVAGNTIAPPLEDHGADQLEGRLTVVISAHPGLHRGVQQAKEASVGLVTTGAALSFLAIPFCDPTEVFQSGAEDSDIVFGGWRRVDQVQHQQDVAAPPVAGRAEWLCWLNLPPFLDQEPS